MVWCRAIVLGSRVATIRSTAATATATSKFRVQSSLNTAQKRFFSVTNVSLDERLYTTKHEWVVVDGDVGTIGISKYAQDALGDVVFAQLPDIGETIQRDDECGALESVKAASELYSPLSGMVVEKNSSVEDTPSLINESCYDKGWLFKLKLSNPDELATLLNGKQYEDYCKKNAE